MALYDLGIELYVADGEADLVIARLANHYRCPVLSMDSDFFVFRLVGGFIHFNYFYWKSSPVTAFFYHRDLFANELAFRDARLICLIPALVGNDFMEPCHPYFIKLMLYSVRRKPRIREICSHLSRFGSVNDFLEQSFGGKTLEPKCVMALQWYEVTEDLSCKELVLSTNLRHHNGGEFPKWLVSLFRLGRLPSYVMCAAVSCKAIFRVVADNFEKESSMLAAKSIREHMYALLEVRKAVEFIRSGLTIAGLKAQSKALKVEEFRGVTLASLEFLSHQQRQSLFYEILQCDKQTINIKLTETNGYQDWRFVAAALSFWARTTCPPEPLVRALLLCFTLCSLPDEKFNALNRQLWRVPLNFRQSQEWLDTLHWFSQWQTIYHTVWTLNALLKEPMWVFSPAFLYDGELAMYLTSSTDTSQWLSKVDTTLYNCLEEIVLSVRLVTPPYDSEDTLSSSDSEDSLSSFDSKDIFSSSDSEDSLSSTDSEDSFDTSGLSLDSPQQAIFVGEHLSSTQSTQSPHGKGQPQTQETTSHCEQHGAAPTQSTPSPKLECGMVVQEVSKKNLIEEQQNTGEHEDATRTLGKACGPEAKVLDQGGSIKTQRRKKSWKTRASARMVSSASPQQAISVGERLSSTQSTQSQCANNGKGQPKVVDEGGSVAKPRKKRWKKKKSRASVGRIEMVSGDTLDNYLVDNASRVIPSAPAAAMASTTSPAQANPNTSEATRKRNRSKQKKAQPVLEKREKMPSEDRQCCKSDMLPNRSLLVSQSAGVQGNTSANITEKETCVTSETDMPVHVCAHREQLSTGQQQRLTSTLKRSDVPDSAIVQGKQLETITQFRKLQDPFFIHKQEFKEAQVLTINPHQGSTASPACSKRMRKRHHGKQTATDQKQPENQDPAANTMSSAQMTRRELGTVTKSFLKKVDKPPIKSKQTMHVPPQQNPHFCLAPQEAASGPSGTITSGGASLRGRQDPQQHSQISLKSTERPQPSKGPTQASFTTSHRSVCAPQPSQLGSKQSFLKTDPKLSGTPDTAQGPGQQPSLTLDASSANAKRRRNRRRQRTWTARKAPQSETSIATNTT